MTSSRCKTKTEGDTKWLQRVTFGLDVLFLCRRDEGTFTSVPRALFFFIIHPWMLSSDIAPDCCLEIVTAKRLLYTNVTMELAVPSKVSFISSLRLHFSSAGAFSCNVCGDFIFLFFFFFQLNLFYIKCFSGLPEKALSLFLWILLMFNGFRRLRFTISSSPLSNPGLCFGLF